MLVVLAVASIHGPSRAYDAAGLSLRLPATWHEVHGAGPVDFAAVGPGTASLAVSHVDIPSGAVLTAGRLADLLRSGTLPLPSDLRLDSGSVRVRSDLALGPAVTARGTLGGHSDDATFVLTSHRMLIFEVRGGRANRAGGDVEQMLRHVRERNTAS